MKQTTAKTRAEVLHWMEHNGHHIADATTPGFFILQGHHDKLRIPDEVWHTVIWGSHFKPASHFDTRMYRPTKYGRSLIRKAGLDGSTKS